MRLRDVACGFGPAGSHAPCVKNKKREREKKEVDGRVIDNRHACTHAKPSLTVA